MNIHIDLETYSSVDLKQSGIYAYTESLDFEILMFAYCIDDEPVQIVDLAAGEKIPNSLIELILDSKTTKKAHNAAFERTCLKKINLDVPIEEWECTQVKAAYCGLPLSLKDIGKVLNLKQFAKDSSGAALIRFFSIPIKPTRANGMRLRNMYYHDKEKWENFKSYCKQDVESEREISRILKDIPFPEFERINYIQDQIINDRGIGVDVDFVNKAEKLRIQNSEDNTQSLKDITNLVNPNSAAQLKTWLSDALLKDIKSLAKEEIPVVLKLAEASAIEGDEDTLEAIKLKISLSKTSLKKYTAILKCLCEDGRVRGLFQFYGANRTGRWAGRLVQLQNLTRNYLKNLDEARAEVKAHNYDDLKMIYDPKDMPDVLSQLIRTSFTASEGKTFVISDFSAIEARVIAWLADETWRLDVFSTHGKIYEASASMMFNIPLSEITPALRTKGKIAELALGYQGSLGALKNMGGEKMGLSEDEMKSIVSKWRKANKNIVKLWEVMNSAATKAVMLKQKIVVSDYKNLEFNMVQGCLTIKLPSGRSLFYREAQVKPNRFNSVAVTYKGLEEGRWVTVDTYGGKLVENIVQAIARDILANSICVLHENGYEVVMHVHDEVIVEVPDNDVDYHLDEVSRLMSLPISWADNSIMEAKAFYSKYYKKED